MKKIKLNSKLSLKKETIAKLNDEQMNTVKGGTVGGNVCVKPSSQCYTYTCPTNNCPASTPCN